MYLESTLYTPVQYKYLVCCLFSVQIKVLHNQLWLLHGALAAHSLSCHHFLEQRLQQAMSELRSFSADSASFLEDS